MMVKEAYAKAVAELTEDFTSFSEAAEKGKEGRGSRTKALEARKLSMNITNKLKDFRALSISNDKVK